MALIIGNWKMHGIQASLREAGAVSEGAGALGGDNHQLVLCPPSSLLMAMSAALADSAVLTGGQDCHPQETGAHTGRISAEMLADAGATYCIVGHSECRAELGDTDALLAEKVAAVLRAGMVPIFCVGESLEVREAGQAEDFVASQLAVVTEIANRVVVAYEPIWAIGTGKTATIDDIAAMHTMMHSKLGEQTPLLYGGSVKPGNAAEILAADHVGGALIGGASLKADDFLAIAKAA
ncbi:MAG: triose-phosphate isomerase [Pseudomonadota bacterium]